MQKYYYLIAALLMSLVICSCEEDCETCVEPEISTLDMNKEIAKAYVHSYAIALSEALEGIDELPFKIEFIRKAIEPVSFYPDSSGYFFVYDYDCVNIAHARQKDLQGTNLYDYQDTKGAYVIRELAEMAQNGGGFVEYWWIKPGETGEKKKLGYVETIPGTNYFIGSGVYLEE